MKKILFSFTIVGVVAVILIAATAAYFSDQEKSRGNTLAVEKFLKVGDDSPTTWNFQVSDIKPGAQGEGEVQLQQIGSSDGYLHIIFSNLLNDDVSCVEPEKAQENGDCGSDPGAGELAENLDILVYLDENSDDVFSLGTDTLVYQGKAKGVLQGDLFNYDFNQGQIEDFRIEWNFSSAMSNIIQSDRVSFKIIFGFTQELEEIVGDWHFNEGVGALAYDSSYEPANDGAINGASWSQGKYNSALSFDGNDNINAGNDASFNLGQVTLEAWVKKAGTPGTLKYIAGKHYASGFGSYNLYTAGTGGLKFYIGHSSGFVASPDAGISIWDGNWHHIVGTYDGARVRLFVDGAQIGAGTPTTVSIASNANNFYIGSYGNGFYFNGLIDEVKLYSRAMGNAEILEHYQAGQ